jgi:Lipocalin-like domain
MQLRICSFDIGARLILSEYSIACARVTNYQTDIARSPVTPIPSPIMPELPSAPSLVGTWRLVSYEARDSKSVLHYPLGKRVSGLLVYDAGGNMSVHVMRNDRPLFATNDAARGTDSEVRTAFEGHDSYFGTYTIDQIRQTVTHHVCGASYPNWIGSDQLRHFKFDGSRLLLSTPPIEFGGQSLVYALIWERIS